jgi:hypothetical protein
MIWVYGPTNSQQPTANELVATYILQSPTKMLWRILSWKIILTIVSRILRLIVCIRREVIRISYGVCVSFTPN